MTAPFRWLLIAAIGVLGVVSLLLHTPNTVSVTAPTQDAPARATLPNDYPIGSVLMIGHWADTPVASTSELIARYQPGGVIIMSAPTNPTEIKSWIDTWQASSSYPLIIAIDQEGGEVSRLRGDVFTQTTQRTITTEAAAYDLGKLRGQELAALGITLNFAPVLDTATSTDSFLHNRTFADPEAAASLAAALTAGMADSGVIAAAKHFPGHPNTSEDSHHTLPTVHITRQNLDQFAKPFRDYIADADPAALMTAHVSFPAIDPRPATLSPFFLSSYLRDQLSFNGAIITDDMSMSAITDTHTPTDAAIASIIAGADMVLLAAEPHLIETVAPALATKAATDTRFATALTTAQTHIYTLQQLVTQLDAQ